MRIIKHVLGTLVLVAGLALILGSAVGCAMQSGYARHPQMGESNKELAVRQTMRTLWADHVVWTRQYIVAAVDGTPDAQSSARRLLKNQEDIGNAIVPYYGPEAGRKLTELLKGHILIAVDLLNAAKVNDQPKFKDADARWHQNADDIAAFLSGANPHWPKSALVEMLNAHLALTTQEAVARLTRKWDDDIAAFDKIFEQAMMMADGLSDGIIKQFPGKL